MSKQSKKRKRRHERQKRQQRDKLLNIFNSLYPAAPEGMAAKVVDHHLAQKQTDALSHLSNTAAVKQAAITYVREKETTYSQIVDMYIDAVLAGIERGEIYTAKTPQKLEGEVNLQVSQIIESWQ